ncbi:MAG: thiol oxidoreductase [Hyphomicrobium sp.]|nr:thiol oxidoreductase [Hyphomicrobium sp.]
MSNRQWRAPACCAVLMLIAGGFADRWSTNAVESAQAMTASDDRMTAALGKALFKRVWVPAPSSTRANDGLGPLFNGRSCVQCHSAAGGGRLVVDRDGRLAERGAVVRLSTPDGSGDPIYGMQIQTRAIPGLNPEASVRVRFQTHTETFDDGSTIAMRRPFVVLDSLSNGPLTEGTEATLIVAPSLQTAARIARVEGRNKSFGLKANAESLEEMTSLAFLRDLGLSTPRFANVAGDCTPQQMACRAAPHGAASGEAEISADIVTPVVQYLATLDDQSKPIAPDDPRGAALFVKLACASCHTPALPARAGTAFSGGLVTLYSDLERHDMGDALAGLTEPDGQSRASWRTAPLIHIQSRLEAGATLLHDGRARTVAEAILWHGGAADAARNRYKALSKDDRVALENYVLGR